MLIIFYFLNPKKIFIDAYTVWCAPCKMLDKNTFANKDVANYINKNYYAVKFNAEGNETIKFDGKTSYIKIPYKNLQSIFNNDFTLSIKLKPEDSKTSLKEEFDEYYAVSIPGRNTGISYTSFKRYKSEIWDKEGNSNSIQSDILGEVWSHLVMVKVDDKLSFYLNNHYSKMISFLYI